MTDVATLTVKRQGRIFNRVRTVEGRRICFSAHQCFQFDGSPSDAACLNALSDYLITKPGLAFFGFGQLGRALLALRPDLQASLVTIIVDDPQSEAIEADAPVSLSHDVPAGVKTVFLTDTETYERTRAGQRLSENIEVVDCEILLQIAPLLIPQSAWTPIKKNIYPIDIPEIRFRENLDVLLLDCPARNLSLMPNGLGYVHNALKRSEIEFQTFDLDIVTYHRYHLHRLFDLGGQVVLPSGREMPEDPWQAEHYDLWRSEDVIEFFMHIIDEAADAVIAARPKTLGLSIQECSESFATALVQRVKDALPDIVIVVGGFSCYNANIGLKAFPLADYMCIGEADLTVGGLVEALARGERPGNVPGVLSVNDDPGRRFVPAPMPHDMDSLDAPHYEWFDLSVYRNFNGYQLVPIIASRGCRWARCTFCAERFYWRMRSPEDFVDELEWLVEQGCTLFMFNESDLNGQPERLLEICDEIIYRGLQVKLTGQLRIHKKSDRAFFQKLREAGFVALRFGVDAFAENTLRLQKKGYTTEMISQNLKDCWEAGIYTEVNWVIGVPGETEEDCDEGVRLILANREYIGRLANINPLILVNGSVYWIDPESHNIRYREPQEDLYDAYPRALPADRWYSEEPYIDAQVRKDRFEKIVIQLHDADFPVGAWAARIIEDVKYARDRSRAGAADVAQDVETVPELCQETANHKIYSLGGSYYAIPRDQEDVDLGAPDLAAYPGIVTNSNLEALVAEIEIVGEWANSRGHFDARKRQGVFGSYLRAASADEHMASDGVNELPRPVLIRHGGEVFQVDRDELSAAFGALDSDSDLKKLEVAHVVTKGAVPDPLTSIGNYNLVEFDGRFYGVPQGCPVKWGDPSIESINGMVICESAKELVDRISAMMLPSGRKMRQRRDVEPAPIELNAASSYPRLLKAIESYNVVAFEGWIYGIPQELGPLSLNEVDVIGLPGVIRDVSEDVVEHEILERLHA